MSWALSLLAKKMHLWVSLVQYPYQLLSLLIILLCSICRSQRLPFWEALQVTQLCHCFHRKQHRARCWEQEHWTFHFPSYENLDKFLNLLRVFHSLEICGFYLPHNLKCLLFHHSLRNNLSPIFSSKPSLTILSTPIWSSSVLCYPK